MEVGGSGAQGQMLLHFKLESSLGYETLSQSPKARWKRMTPPSLDEDFSESEIQRTMNNLEEGAEGGKEGREHARASSPAKLVSYMQLSYFL